MEFAVGNLNFNRIKEFSNRRNPLRVTYKYYFVCQVLWLQMKMETTAVFVDYKF